MNAPDKPLHNLMLPDIQGSPDHRDVAINQVGVRGLRYPLTLIDSAGETHPTVASVTMTVGLPPTVKGTHMSRFVEIMEAQDGPLSLIDMKALFNRMRHRLEAKSGRVEFTFPYFIRKQAPVSGVTSLIDIDAGITLNGNANGQTDITLRVVVPVTSLCPCSKEISNYGAHNQRSHITIQATLKDNAELNLEDLVRMAEEEASCEVFGLLKRPDEKWVTERAYDNPKFVEDLVRDIALRLKEESRIGYWSVSSENFESIHNHSAYALIEGSNS
jgi:GTP cyclohydrolase I